MTVPRFHEIESHRQPASIVLNMPLETPTLNSRRRVVAAAAVLLALTMWALVSGSSIPDELIHFKGDDTTGDLALYERIIERVEDGEGYYLAAVDEQFGRNYPTSPPTAIRLPTMSYLNIFLGSLAPFLLPMLVLLAVVMTMIRLEKFAPSRVEWYFSILLAAAFLGIYAHGSALFLQEAWAMIFMALAILWHRPGRYRTAVVLGFLAACFRELSGPFLVIMGLLAWRRDRRESLTWFAAAAVYLALYSIHWLLASQAAAGTSHRASPGWVTFGGWPYVVDTARFSSAARTLPFWISAVLVALALLGWILIRTEYGTKVLAVTLGFMAVFMIAGRPNTAYWGHLYVALLLPGLAFAPRAVALSLGWTWPTRAKRHPIGLPGAGPLE